MSNEMPSLLSPLIQDDVSVSNVPAQGEEASDDEEGNRLSYQELKSMHDDEEIERFLNLFSATVTEIRIPDTPDSEPVPIVETDIAGLNLNARPLSDGEVHVGDVNTPASMRSEQLPMSVSNTDLCRTIVSLYLIPNLPPQSMPEPIFTLGRLRIAAQRLYLAVQPTYFPFFLDIVELATWQDWERSLKFCVIYWILWYWDLLLPALVLRILYALIHNRILPHPTLSKLRRHRKEVRRADEFGKDIQARLSSSSILEIKEVWRMFSLYRRAKKARSKIRPEELTKDEPDDPTVLDEPEESKDEQDIKRAVLRVTTEIADLHERIKNIFIWRRPSSSRLYGIILAILFLVVLFVPAHYLAKLSYFVTGFFFWHITPMLAALSPSERTRLPPPFADVPTDADYAMELISKRVAAGLHVTPEKNKKARRSHKSTGSDPQQGDMEPLHPEEDKAKINWKKWGERVAVGKAWVDDGRRLMARSEGLKTTSSSESLPASTASVEDQQGIIETHTFIATFNALPGLITLTSIDLRFTPMLHPDPKIIIPLNDLRGVKKAGIIKGLSLRWVDRSVTGTKVEKEEKFMWVGDRDELFARLLGTSADGKRWLRA